ncbi:MAG: type 4a pilus biogenesis protein PilO, partial [Panacagrimonas sp.]
MGTFVSGVASLPRIVTVDEVEIKPEKPIAGGRNAPATLNPDGLRMTAIAKTYRYLDEDELAAQEAAKKAAVRAGGKP